MVFPTNKPRKTEPVIIACFAPEELFLPWNELSPEIKEWYKHNDLPCEGDPDCLFSGCMNCIYGQLKYDNEDDFMQYFTTKRDKNP